MPKQPRIDRIVENSFTMATMQTANTSDPRHDPEIEALIHDCIDFLLSTLPPEQAKIVHAVDIEGASIDMVAQRQNLGIDAVNTLLARGRQGLKNRFGDMYMICPEHSISGCGCHLKGDAKSEIQNNRTLAVISADLVRLNYGTQFPKEDLKMETTSNTGAAAPEVKQGGCCCGSKSGAAKAAAETTAKDAQENAPAKSGGCCGGH